MCTSRESVVSKRQWYLRGLSSKTGLQWSVSTNLWKWWDNIGCDLNFAHIYNVCLRIFEIYWNLSENKLRYCTILQSYFVLQSLTSTLCFFFCGQNANKAKIRVGTNLTVSKASKSKFGTLSRTTETQQNNNIIATKDFYTSNNSQELAFRYCLSICEITTKRNLVEFTVIISMK